VLDNLASGVAADESVEVPIPGYICTDFARWQLVSGDRILEQPMTSVGGTIDNVVLTWTEDYIEDETVEVLYTRSWSINPANASASSTGTGYSAGNPFDYAADSYSSRPGNHKDQTKAWRSGTGAFPHSIVYAMDKQRVISYLSFCPEFYYDEANTEYISLVDEFEFYGSNSTNNASSDTGWTLLYSGSFEKKLSEEFRLTQTSGYLNYKIKVLSSKYNGSTQTGFSAIEMRESGSTRDESDNVISFQTSVSNNGGSTFGSWNTCTNGAAVTGVSAGVAASNLVIKLKPTLYTENQKYQPVVSSITLTENGEGAASLESITVTPSTPSIIAGNAQQFTATGTYDDDSTEDLTSTATWASSSTGVATITIGGLATGVAAGTTSISATLGAVSDSETLTVTAPPTITGGYSGTASRH